MVVNPARRLPAMQKKDWGILLLAIVLVPIWVPVALLGGIWALVFFIFSRLPLPGIIGVPLGLAWAALLVPLYPVLMLMSAAWGHLLRERMVVDESVITIRGLFSTRQIAWSEITQVVEVFSPPINTFKFVLVDGKEFELGAFAEIGPVLQAAPRHGVQVRRAAIPFGTTGSTGDSD